VKLENIIGVFLLIMLFLMIILLPKQTTEETITKDEIIIQENKAKVCLENKNFDYECSLFFLNKNSLKLCYKLEAKLRDNCLFTYANSNNDLNTCHKIYDLDLKKECIENLEETILPDSPEE